MEPKYPGLVERYVNLGDCYDRAGLQPLRQELMGCMKGYKACYQRAYRCLTAAAQIGEDLRSLLLTPALEAKMAKRARGILSREVKKGDGEAGRAVQRFLGGVTWKGVLCQFETVDALCKRVYELADTYGLAHSMLTHLAAGALASGHDVIVCPSPLFPDRMEHLLIPSLSLAFVSASPSLPYPKRPYRRIRLDAMADAELLRRNKARLKFSRKVSAALVEEAVDSLAQAKAQPECVPLAVYDGDTLVGFAMYAMDVEDKEYWIYRLMVGQEFQSRGYGRKMLALVLDQIKQDPTHHMVYLSCNPENVWGRALYESVGFRPDGRDHFGEMVYRLDWE